MIRKLLLGTLWLTSLLSAQIEAPYFHVEEVFEFQDIKYYRLRGEPSSPVTTNYLEKEVGLLSKSRFAEYELLVPNQTLQNDFSLLQSYPNNTVSLSFVEPRCKHLHTYLHNPLQIELKTTFALLHFMGQKKSALLFQFQDRIQTLEQKTQSLQKQLSSATLGEFLALVDAFQNCWQELAELTTQIQEEIQKDPELEKFSPLASALVQKIQGRKLKLVELFHGEILQQDLAARLQFLAPYLGREMTELVAEHKKIQSQQEQHSSAQQECWNQYQKSIQIWNQQLTQEILFLHQQELQEQMKLFEIRYHSLVSAQVEQEKLKTRLNEITTHQQEFTRLQQILQNQTAVSNAYQQALNKQKEIQQAKTRIIAIQKKLQALANLEEIQAEWKNREILRQEKTAELQQINQEIPLLQAEQKKLQVALENAHVQLTQQTQSMLQNQQELDLLIQIQSTNQEEQKRYQTWLTAIEKWEQTQQPHYEQIKREQQETREQLAQISLTPYQNLANELMQLEEAKAQIAPVEKAIEKRLAQQKEFALFQQQNDQQHKELLAYQEELHQIFENKETLSQKELALLQKQVSLCQQNEQALQKLFFSYLQELLRLEENVFRRRPAVSLTIEAITAIEIPQEWSSEQKASWNHIQLLLYQILSIRLHLVYQKYTFLIHHLWLLQTETSSAFQESFQKKLQTLQSIKNWLNSQKRKLGETIEVEFEFLMMGNAWAKTVLQQETIREDLQKQFLEIWKEYTAARSTFVAEVPESEALFLQSIQEIYFQTKQFPEFGENLVESFFSEETRSAHQDFLKKWNDFNRVEKEIAEHFLLQEKLNETFIQKSYLLQLLQKQEQNVISAITKKEKEQTSLQEKYQVTAKEMAELPALEEQKNHLQEILGQEPQLLQKAETYQTLLTQQKEKNIKLAEYKKTCEAYEKEEKEYQKIVLQKEEMSTLAEQIKQQIQTLEKLPATTNTLQELKKNKAFTLEQIALFEQQLQEKTPQIQEKEIQQKKVQSEIPEEKTFLEQQVELEQKQKQKELFLREQNELETFVAQENTLEKQIITLTQQVTEFNTLTNRKQELETQIKAEPKLLQQLQSYETLPEQFRQLETEKNQVEKQLQKIRHALEKESQE